MRGAIMNRGVTRAAGALPSWILLLLAAAGCSTSAKLAEPSPYDISRGDYLTEEEYKELSKDEAQEYCERLEQEIDIQEDNAAFSEESLAQMEAEIAELRNELAALGGSPSSGPDETRVGGAHSHTVVRGDWLSKLAARFYGDWPEWPKIFEANRGAIRNPDLIYPGQVLEVPGQETKFPGRVPQVPPGETKRHRVQPGETLRIIAEREYGSREEWERIWDANREDIRDPDRIPVGLELTIPR
jgi:nucleoid-associated protein YgaU